ncbi:hypothetical protein GGI21_004509 [Coemansia aciculifera]|nr:hypothetical protein GGI21_004509 [Coemansia aciculifera]
MANIGTFIQRIKQLAPMANEIQVECGNMYNDQHPETEIFKVLLAQLIQLTPRFLHRVREDCRPVELQVDSTNVLTHIDIETKCIEPVVQLARQSAGVLQSLCIRTRQSGNISELIKDASGDYVEYPQLRVLKLAHYGYSGIDPRPAMPGAVPFPNLRVLKVAHTYPFEDDVLFRGNAATLESLEMLTGVDTLERYRVFTPASHAKLQYVRIGYVTKPFHRNMATYMQFLLDIGPNAAVRAFGCDVFHLPHMIPLLGGYPSIQVLCIPSVDMSLWDAVSVITSLPLLSDLYVRKFALGQLPKDVTTMDELPAHMVSKFGQIGKRFRCCHVSFDWRGYQRDTVPCVLLLALICPSLDYCFSADKYSRGDFMTLMKEAVGSDCFKDHAPRLQRLLVGD